MGEETEGHEVRRFNVRSDSGKMYRMVEYRYTEMQKQGMYPPKPVPRTRFALSDGTPARRGSMHEGDYIVEADDGDFSVSEVV